MEAKEGGGGRGRAPALESGARAGCPRPASTREAGRGGPSPRGGRGAVTGSAENSEGGGLQPGSGGQTSHTPRRHRGKQRKVPPHGVDCLGRGFPSGRRSAQC